MTERLHFHFHFHALEKEMATHSSVLAWRIPGTGDPGGAAVYGVAQSQTRLKRLSSSSSTSCEIIVPQAGMEPMPLAVAAQSSNHWTAREVPLSVFFI